LGCRRTTIANGLTPILNVSDIQQSTLPAPKMHGGDRKIALYMTMLHNPRDHWQHIYETRAATAVSWYQPSPDRSLELIRIADVPTDAAILDVGGGASTLVDHLLAVGYANVTVLDLASAALAAAQARLGPAATCAQWVDADVCEFQPPRQYDLWHDRAVLHFLVDPAQRDRYLRVLRQALRPGGHVIIAAFSPAGPQQCSGLPVQRYDVDVLTELLGPSFRLIQSAVDTHVTPGGAKQEFAYGLWQRGVHQS
jgi:SAM-dependent methyltransferase